MVTKVSKRFTLCSDYGSVGAIKNICANMIKMSIFCGINNNYGSLYLSFLSLFLCIEPYGTVPVQVLTQNDPKKKNARISLWTAINVFIILIVFFYRTICFAFGIGIDALRIAGALSL
jgi:hypothetical protein